MPARVALGVSGSGQRIVTAPRPADGAVRDLLIGEISGDSSAYAAAREQGCAAFR